MTTRAEELLGLIDGIPFEAAADLGDEDVRWLVAAATGGVAVDQEGADTVVSRSGAMDLLVRARPQEAVPVLAQVLRGDEDPLARAAAAAGLGRAAAQEPGVVDLLQEAAASERDRDVRIRLAGALGKVGDERSFDALRALEDDEDDAVRRQARFGRMLIQHRIGDQGGVELLAPAETVQPVDELLDFEWMPADRELVAEVARSLAGDTYGVDLSDPAAFVLECEPSRFVVLLDSALVANGLPDVVVRRPVLAGLVAQWFPVTMRYAVRWLLLAGPGREADGYVFAYRTDGIPAFAGGGRLDGDGAAFSLGTVDAPGNLVVDIGGHISGSRVELDRRGSTRRVTRSAIPDRERPR